MEEGVWRTIGGRRVFIKKGQRVSDAMRESGKYSFTKRGSTPLGKYRMNAGRLGEKDYKNMINDFEDWYNTLDKREVNKLLDDYDRYKETMEGKMRKSNPVGEFINKKIGYDGKPELIDEKDFYKNKDGKIIEKYDNGALDDSHWFRGIGAGSDSDTEQFELDRMKEEFKNGKYFAGTGVSGNGTYATIDHSYALDYARGVEENVMKMTPKIDARIVDYNVIRDLRRNIVSNINLGEYLGDKEDLYYFMDLALRDEGYLASLMGYDIITISDGRRVVLNRGAVKVVK